VRKSPLFKLLSRIVDIKPGEQTLVVLLFFCFFLITAPHTIIKALRYAGLLHKTGPKGLPIAYLSAAVVTGLVVVLHSKIQIKFSNRTLMTSSLMFFVLSGVLLHVFLQTDVGRESAFLVYVYWVWAYVLVTVLVTQFWLIVVDIFNPREAKRLIGICGSGGILGGVLGGALAGFLARSDLANVLLPLACGLLLVCIFVVRALFVIRHKQPDYVHRSLQKKDRTEAQQYGFKDSLTAVRKNRYLVVIAMIVVITVVVSTFIDFHFSSAVKEHFFDKRAMQAFFGLFYSGLSVFAFFVNIFLTALLLKKIGVRFTLLLTPATLFLGTAAAIFAPFTLAMAALVKSADEGLGFSLQQSVRELLYIPVSSELKHRAKPFIDMFISRFAKVLAAILLFLFALTLEKEVDYLTPIADPGLAKDLLWGVLAFLAIWMIFSVKIYSEYIKAIRKSIPPPPPSADEMVKDKLDVDYTKMIFDTIESQNRSSVLYALHLFDLLEQDKLTPEIKSMITQKTDEVQAASVSDLFNAEGATWFPEIDDDVNQEAFITDIREIMSSEVYQQLIGMHVEQVLEEDSDSEVGRMELAKMIGLMDPESPLVNKLEALINDKSVDVSRYAIQSAARLKQDKHLPAIIRELGNPLLHEDAVTALKKYGQSALSILEQYLKDSIRTTKARKDVVKVLAQIGTQDTVRILLDEMGEETEELDADIVDALDRIRAEKSDIHFPPKLLRKKIFKIVIKYCQVYIDWMDLGPEVHNTPQERQLQNKLAIDFSNIFKLLGLYYPREDIVKAYQNLQTDTKNSVAYAIELLDNTLNKEMKGIILPLAEDLSPGEKQREFQRILRILGKA
jgi:AAA family ATP:ADP antiporter